MRLYSDSAEVVIRRNEEKDKSKVEKMQELMEQWAREAVGKESDVKTRLSACQLDKLIAGELQNRGIDQKFQYGVLSSDSKQILLSNCRGNCSDDLVKTKFKTQLFP